MPQNTVKLVDFLSPLQLTVLNDKSYRLLKDFLVCVEGELIEILEGFETDLASVPRVPIVYTAVGGRGHKAAVLHDWLYVTNHYDRKKCDLVFYHALRESGIGYFSAQAMYMGVRLGGGRAYRTDVMAKEEIQRRIRDGRQ